MEAGLERFIKAQASTYEGALAELRAGSKRGHWMWFVFPQVAGLGWSPTARVYAIRGLAEAREYLAHPVLGARLAECTEAMLGWAGRKDAASILGEVDAMKFRSSMTLFEAAGGPALFGKAIDSFYAGERDKLTLDLI